MRSAAVLRLHYSVLAHYWVLVERHREVRCLRSPKHGFAAVVVVVLSGWRIVNIRRLKLAECEERWSLQQKGHASSGYIEHLADAMSRTSRVQSSPVVSPFRVCISESSAFINGVCPRR